MYPDSGSGEARLEVVWFPPADLLLACSLSEVFVRLVFGGGDREREGRRFRRGLRDEESLRGDSRSLWVRCGERLLIREGERFRRGDFECACRM